MAAAAGAAAAVAAAGEPIVEVLDALELASLVRRTPTLDGAVPLRAAQACVPLLEGNAYGLHVRLSRALVLERRLGRAPRVRAEDPRVDERLSAARKAALPRLVAQGLVSPAWARAFERSLAFEQGGVLHVFTGLLVRPPAGAWLRVGTSANRRSTFYDLDEVFVPDEGGFVPLVLSLRPRVAGPLRLDAEVATLSCVVPDRAAEAGPLTRAAAEAHATFYDAAYFAHKKGQSTRKYRKLAPDRARAAEDDGRPIRVVEAGPVAYALARRDRVLSAHAATPGRSASGGVTAIDFLPLLPFEAAWDGLSLTLSYDRAELATKARALEEAWASTLGRAFVDEHRGALLYLTKYFTQHPPGEPHFFVKPWAFVHTPPGWSSLVDGPLGEGFEVMRGVVQTDWFHAAPAVFRVFAARSRVGMRAPIVSVLPFPRSLASPSARAVGWPA